MASSHGFKTRQYTRGRKIHALLSVMRLGEPIDGHELKRRLEALGCRVHSVRALSNWIFHNARSRLRTTKDKNKKNWYRLEHYALAPAKRRVERRGIGPKEL